MIIDITNGVYISNISRMESMPLPKRVTLLKFVRLY